MRVNFNGRQLDSDEMDGVRAMLSGDAAAFETFFAAHFPRLFRFALSRLGGNEDAAEDVVQLTLTKAVRKLDTFRGEASLFTWLCTFCRHEISADYQRRGKEEILMQEDLSEIKQALEVLEAPEDEQPESRLRRKETARQVHLVLDRLPARYGDALEWKYVEGLSVLEIAERLRVGTKAAESLLTRARSAFRQMFSNVTLLSSWPQAGRNSKE